MKINLENQWHKDKTNGDIRLLILYHMPQTLCHHIFGVMQTKCRYFNGILVFYGIFVWFY